MMRLFSNDAMVSYKTKGTHTQTVPIAEKTTMAWQAKNNNSSTGDPFSSISRQPSTANCNKFNRRNNNRTKKSSPVPKVETTPSTWPMKPCKQDFSLYKKQHKPSLVSPPPTEPNKQRQCTIPDNVPLAEKTTASWHARISAATSTVKSCTTPHCTPAKDTATITTTIIQQWTVVYLSSLYHVQST